MRFWCLGHLRDNEVLDVTSVCFAELLAGDLQLPSAAGRAAW